jgi:predicted 3-demethylubiquinone-9 3-methyltransferase (glyoxalase superfamily)
MTRTQKITPHLWFDREAKEAAEFYTSAFSAAAHPSGRNGSAAAQGRTRVKDTSVIHNTPSGSVDIVTIELSGQEFTLISAGPLFRFTPAVSFLVSCRTVEEVDTLWEKLAAGGAPRMELGRYPFAEWYGWIQDRYGLSWQLMLAGNRRIRQKITPTLMFVGQQCGKAEEAVNFYASVFRKAKVGDILRYGKGEEPDREGTTRHASFILEGQNFAAMDSARMHDVSFNEAISFMVHCDTQREIDYYWGQLSASPADEQCGWLKDRYGLSWQVVPAGMDRMLRSKDEKKLARVTEAFLKMKKFDIKLLEKACRGT